MKKVMLITGINLIVLMATISPLVAQTNVELGIKGGLNVANITGDVSNTNTMLGFVGGGLAKINTNPQFSIQPELLVTLKGAQQDEGGNEKLKLTYLEIPVLGVYNFPTSSSTKPYILAGPALGILISAKAGEDDFKDNVNSTDFGFVLGGGVGFPAGENGKVVLDGRYAVGLANIAKDSEDDTIKCTDHNLT